MVLIINGDIVQDDDPRAVRYRSSSYKALPPQPPPSMNRSAALGATVENEVSFHLLNSITSK